MTQSHSKGTGKALKFNNLNYGIKQQTFSQQLFGALGAVTIELSKQLTKLELFDLTTFIKNNFAWNLTLRCLVFEQFLAFGTMLEAGKFSAVPTILQKKNNTFSEAINLSDITGGGEELGRNNWESNLRPALLTCGQIDSVMMAMNTPLKDLKDRIRDQPLI